jgi:4-hydroxy-3-polyprenylbenzoate decarboxylase
MRRLLIFSKSKPCGRRLLFKDLRDYVGYLERNGLIRYVDVELDPVLEIPEFARRVILSRGPTIVFRNIRGFPGWRMISNIFRGLDVFKIIFDVKDLEEVGERVLKLLPERSPESFFDKARLLIDLIRSGRYLPRKTSQADFLKNIVERDGFNKVPIPKIWPKDGGRYITYGILVTKDLYKDVYNLGVYRAQVIDGERAAIHWFIHKRAAYVYKNAKEMNIRKIPAAIVVGTDPATMAVAAMPTPYPIDEYLFTSLLKGVGVELIDLDGVEVPANSEIVFRGYISLDELVDEGPFGDYRGYYDYVNKVPVFKLERLYYRDDPLYYFTVVGRPYMEDTWIGKAVERIFLPFIKLIFPEIIDINLPPEGLFTGGIAFVSIKKRFPGHAKKVMSGLWGLGLFSLVKMIIVVDEHVNTHDLGQILYSIAVNVDPSRDVIVINDMPTDELDFVSKIRGLGSKLGIDATIKFPEENYGREWPEKTEPDPDVYRKIDDLLRRLGLI